MRKRLYEIIETAAEGDRAGEIYDSVLFIAICLSLVPLAFRETTPVLSVIELVTAAVFILDYVFRWLTADYKLKKGALSFVLYPFTLMAVLDLLSILPVFRVLGKGFRAVKVVRLAKCARIFRFFRYSRNVDILVRVVKREKESLTAVCILAATYVLLSALIIFNVEPETFASFFDALYWAVVSLTTVGYGDIYPVSTAGRIVTMVSSIVGIAIVALPSGIITAGYMEEVEREKEQKEDPCDPEGERHD